MTDTTRRRWLRQAGLLGAAPWLAPLLPAPGGALAQGAADPAAAGAALPPALPREFRAAWVASVAHIDWPSKAGLTPDQQRAEALAMIRAAAALGLNALVLQVRPALDAFYPSPLEPWSEYLTGEQGRAPQPPWDPLAFWVEQAHAAGLELHAWFNPYRARHPSAKGPLAASHIANTRPEWVRRYGDMLWLDPAEPGAAAHTLAVVADVVRRYDVDGVHIDDYFYPYPVKQGDADVPFPDDAPWARYQAAGGLLPRDDWRRAHVDALVQALHETVIALKPWVRVGVSPFGLGRPERRPPGITGFSQRDKLYADVERWLENGWLDYLAPQLYWPIDRTAQAFGPLLDYWIAQNPLARDIWPGLFTSMITKGEPLGPRSWPAQEIVNQVALMRTRPGAGGHIHFSMVALMQDRDGIAARLRQGAYAQAALPPAMARAAALEGNAPPAPQLALQGSRASGFTAVALQAGAGAPVRHWALWRRVQGQWRFATLPPPARAFALDGADAVAVAGIGRAGVEGAWARLVLPG